MSDKERSKVFTDQQWELIGPILPSSTGRPGRKLRVSHQVIEGIVFPYRTGYAWRDLPKEFGHWQTAWKRHRRYVHDVTADKILIELLAHADAAGEIGWKISMGSTINHAHQHATNTTRPGQHTTGSVELQETNGRC